MSDDEDKIEDGPGRMKVGKVGNLIGKTMTHAVQIQFTDPDVERNSYFVIYGDKDEEGKRDHYILSVIKMWSESKGTIADLQVLGDRPRRPFDIHLTGYRKVSPVFLCSKQRTEPVDCKLS